MPLCVLLWILVLIPVAILVWTLVGIVTEMDGDRCASVSILMALALCLAAPNLLWYKSVCDVMFIGSPPLEQPVDKPKPVTVELEAPAVFHPELMVQ